MPTPSHLSERYFYHLVTWDKNKVQADDAHDTSIDTPIMDFVVSRVRRSRLGAAWCSSLVPESVCRAGRGRSSVEAWFTSAHEIDESFSGAVDSHVHLFLADVVESSDTVDMEILDRVLSRLGLPAWFRHAYFEYHANVRLRFQLHACLGESWTREGVIAQGCPHEYNVHLCLFTLPWCRYLEAQEEVMLQLRADNLKCVSGDPDVLLRSLLGVSDWLGSILHTASAC